MIILFSYCLYYLHHLITLPIFVYLIIYSSICLAAFQLLVIFTTWDMHKRRQLKVLSICLPIYLSVCIYLIYLPVYLTVYLFILNLFKKSALHEKKGNKTYFSNLFYSLKHVPNQKTVITRKVSCQEYRFHLSLLLLLI